MSEWKEYKLEEITEPIKETYNPNGSDEYAYIGLEHIEQESLRLNSVGISSDVTSNKFKFLTNDVLFGKLRPYFRKVAQPQFDGICSTDIWVFRVKNGFDQDFLFYFLANWDFVDTANGGEGGTKMPRADWNFLKATSWNVPPITEQRAIASILSSLDDKIDLLHCQNKTLEQLAETLFRQWFVEGVEKTNKIYLGSVAEVGTGKGLLREEFIENGEYPILGANGEIGRTNKFLTDERLILTGRVGTLGKVYINESKVWISDNVLIIKPTNEQFFYPIYFSLKKIDFENLNIGSTQPLVTQTAVKNIELNIPSNELLNEFSIQCFTYFEKISKNKFQIRTLTQLRDTLLPKLMSGELRVT
ncbi:MAG: restriction endonuclease subunit S [Melioribacter sp.]|nr:restriction endonuclease subunit S [Melioribacter sp.]